MKKKGSCIIFLHLLLISNFLCYSQEISTTEKIPKNDSQNILTDDMIDKINTTVKQSIYSIAENVKFDGQILRTDELVFSPNSTLELTNLKFDWIVILANKIKFAAFDKKATIKRSFDIASSNGGDGTSGTEGANGVLSGRHGTGGGNGGNGQNGTKGKTTSLPKIFIITNEVTSQASNQAPDYINLKLIFPGIEGGEGGRGGRGGDGGNGGNGRKASDGIANCKSGPGDGGLGGNAGIGGKGGDAGDGGNGAEIIFIGPEAALDILSYSTINNVSGDPGVPGKGGKSGVFGVGGQGGSSSRFCGGGSKGGDGASPNPPVGANGEIGNAGEKGSVFKYNISDFKKIIF